MKDLIPDIFDTLFVWDSLQQAKDGINPYGKTVAEIYVQHLLPHKFEVEDEKEAWKQASKNLKKVVTKFCELNGVKAHIDGKEVGEWMNNFELRHKCDVSIFNNKTKSIRKK